MESSGRCRAGGFMVVLPHLEEIMTYLEEWLDPDGAALVLNTVVEVQMETSRGRAFSTASAILADFPWELLTFFRRTPHSRSSELTGILRFNQQDTVLRPNAASAMEAAEHWINNQSTEEVQFQEYVTAAEEEEVGDGQEDQEPVATLEGADPADQTDIIQQLQARLLELESKALTVQSKAAPPAPSRNLFSTQPPGNLNTATWAKLQAAAGQAPPRLGRFEPGVRAGQPRPTLAQDNFLEAEVEAEVIDKDEFASLAASMTDPMQKLMALQLKQNQDLLTRIFPKQQDSITSALSGMGNEGGSSSTGVRGCTAREAYLKQVEDHSMVARCVMQNAMKDMGVAVAYPGLMRDYLERRVPLGEMKLLTLFGYFMAHAWETAFIAQDETFPGFASRGLMMVEQAAMDAGKTQMGWLLTGLPEPNWALVNQNRKRQGIQPFAKLCQPSWIAATFNCRQRETRQEGQETMAKSKGQGRSRRRRRHLVLNQSMNHGLSGTMSSTSGTADRCFTSRVETDDSFAKDVSFFDACGSSHNLKGRSFCDSVDSPNICDRPPLNFCADNPDTFSFLDILDRCMQTNMKVHVGLRDFILLSCEPATRTAQSGAQCSRDLMPCPPPLWRWTGSQRPSPKQRRKKRCLKLIHRIVQQVICTLNWEALGHVVKPPPAACAGFCISPDQHLMIERIESMILRFATAGSFEASTLGRSADKLERLFVACQELPGAAQDVDLLDVVNSVRQGLDPYGSNSSSKTPKNPEAFCPKAQQTVEHASVDFCASPDPGSKIHLDSSTCKPVIADRIKWEHSPNFDPRPFLTDPVVKAAFDNPETLRLPPECWIKKPCGRVHCNRKEVLKLAKKWDEKGALKIFKCSEVNHDEAVGIFAVGKDATWDRLILNPVINGRMKSYSNYTKSLAPGCLVGLVQLAPDEVLRISADDLAEMYYTFMVPDERAKRNCIRMKFSPRELSQFSSFNPTEHTSSCYLALGALAMGDSLAVEIAQQAHFQVLVQLAGSLRDSERVAYRKPFPRGKFYEFLAIDDYLGLQVVSQADFASGVRARDSEIFERAGAAYRKVGLVQHPKKKKRGVTQGTFLGAEVDGIEGKVSAPRHRTGLLMMCTSIVAAKGFVTPKLLSAILGSWISALMFRRPIMSVMQSVFSEGSGKKQDEIFELSRQSRNELLALSILGPLAQTDLRTQTCPKIFCMDASPHGSGICQVDEDANVVTELWRHSEQKGFYTRLSNPAASILEELGLPSEAVFGANIEPVHTSVNFPPPRSLREGFIFDCIELFKGEGNWSIAHSSVHLKVHPGLDVHGRRVAYVDMMDPAAFAEITALAYRGVIREWHAGPPCFTFGTLRRPRIRNKAQPWGFNNKDPLTIEQNSLARRTAFLLCIALLQGCFISVEQPGSSVMFYMHAFKVLAMLGCVFSRFCFCTYGAALKKPSKWLHNKPWLLELESKCQCKSPSDHFIIQGNFTRDNVKDFEAKCRPSSVEVYGRTPRVGESVASYSASYPIPLCRRMALGSLAHKNGQSPIIPLSRKMQTLKELSLSEAEPSGSEPTNIPAWRSWHEDPDWIGELADCLHFSELLRYKFRKAGHINVLECRTYKTWLKHCARCHPNSRLVALLDSRVTLGAAAKGRSSSFALSRVLQGSLGYVLGGGLYPGGLHVESTKNRSDGPSRNRSVPAPTKDSPGWLVALRKGNYDPFDAVLSSAFFARGPGRWVRFLILLCGDVECNPGPFSDNMRCRHDRVPRGPLDSTVGFATATATRMDHCLHAFRLWISEYLQTTFDALAENPHTMALSLRGYGLFLYEQGYPRYFLVYAIIAMQDRLPHFRGFMAPAWQVDRKWQQAEPGECRPVISGPILCAAISVAAMWGWHFWIGVSMIGFLGMLYPAEFLNLCRQDLVLPKDALVDQQIAYVYLRNPKTSRFARRQHAKIEDPFAVKYLEALYGSRPLNFKLFPGTVTIYRRQWDAIMDRFEVPHSRQTRGATPATLRGSGATHLYLATEDIQLIAWRGRWTKVKTIEFYLQEVAAQLILHHLSASAKTRIQLLASWVTSLLESAMASFQWNTPSN